MSTPALTLYQIETELLELLQLRDEVAAEVIVTQDGEDTRQAQLGAIDRQIEEYVRREVVKVDNVAGLIRECKARAGALEAEEKRLRALRKNWEEREERVKRNCAEAVAAQLDQARIIQARQNTVLKRLTGQHSELKLCKSPVSVEVTDALLLPPEYLWTRETVIVDTIGIAKALKRGEAVAGARLVNDSVHVRLA